MASTYGGELARIRKFIKRTILRGFEYPTNLLDLIKQESKSIEDLKKFTAKTLYNYATYYDPLTGKTITGTERARQERSIKSKKGWETRKEKQKLPKSTDEVLRVVQQLLDRWSPSEKWSSKYLSDRRSLRDKFQRMLDGAIAMEGRDAVAKRLEGKAAQVISIVETIALAEYITDDPQSLTLEFSAILMGRVPSMEESRELTGLHELSESYEELPI